jgi:hypothetical protein
VTDESDQLIGYDPVADSCEHGNGLKSMKNRGIS